jgi:hypothetical protein
VRTPSSSPGHDVGHSQAHAVPQRPVHWGRSIRAHVPRRARAGPSRPAFAATRLVGGGTGRLTGRR